MSDDAQESKHPDKAMQVLQLIMLTVLIGGGGYIGNSVLETQRAMAKLMQQMDQNASDHAAFNSELRAERDTIQGLDHRVTIIETRVK